MMLELIKLAYDELRKTQNTGIGEIYDLGNEYLCYGNVFTYNSNCVVVDKETKEVKWVSDLENDYVF